MTSDFRENRPVHPERFKPSKPLAGFPDDIAACIDTWNDTFNLNFFYCRSILRRISMQTLSAVPDASVMSEQQFALSGDHVSSTARFLAYVDDDDWFSPATSRVLQDLDQPDDVIHVFPLIRFDDTPFTFVRARQPARLVMGEQRLFDFRFQTNNYILRCDQLAHADLLACKDHVEASSYADAHNFPDAYHDVLISATAKTPCSAGKLASMPVDPSAYIASTRHYVEKLEGLSLTGELSWCREPLAATVNLFKSVLDGARLG